MIYQLQKKFIRICVVSVFFVVAVIFVLIYGVSAGQLDQAMDTLADRISDHDSRFPGGKSGGAKWEVPKDAPDFMTKETPFSTRFFIVRFDENGQAAGVDVSSVSAVTEETAREFGTETYASGRKRGWEGDYRYKRYETQDGSAIIFVDGSMNRFLSNRQLLSAGGVLIVSALAILFIILFFSKRAVRPVAESYEKQKQFITDANHELKTPLTLVLANLDILEMEIGENEWLSDIRSEGERMSALVNQLVALARMDEDQTSLEMRPFSMSGLLTEAASDFQLLAKESGKSMCAQIEPDVTYTGNEESIRRVCTILLDNALKYCDEGGSILLRLEKKRHPVLFVENTYADVEKTELDKLFDRFYRVDKARTFHGNFGVGLSIAKAIVTQHKSEISAYQKDRETIEFQIVWR